MVDVLDFDIVCGTSLDVYGGMVSQKTSTIAFELAMAEKNVQIVYVLWETIALDLLVRYYS